MRHKKAKPERRDESALGLYRQGEALPFALAAQARRLIVSAADFHGAAGVIAIYAQLARGGTDASAFVLRPSAPPVF